MHAQGRMSLGQSVTHGAPQTLWACCALVLGSEAADLALRWPDDLVRLIPRPYNCLSCACETLTFPAKTASHSSTSYLRPVLRLDGYRVRLSLRSLSVHRSSMKSPRAPR